MTTKPKRARKAKPEGAPLELEGKFNPTLCATFVGIVRRGNFRETACAQVGITPQTLRSWLRAASTGVLERRALSPAERAPFVDFVRKLDKAEAEAESLLVMAVRTAALKGDVKAATWMLERRGAARWGFKANVEVSVEQELQRILNVVERELGGEAATRVFAALADSEPGEGAAPSAPSGATQH